MHKIRGLLVAAALLIALVGCSSSTSTIPAATGSGSGVANGVVCTKVGTVHFAKTKFLLHTGLGVGALYKFVYKPFQSGKFKKGAKGRVTSIVLGGAATLFAVHELKVAKKDAEADKTLCKLVAPLNVLTAKLTGMGSQLKSGNANPASIAGTGLGLQALAGQSGSLGAQIKQIVPPSLGSYAP